jgi:hypothetical protein
MPDNQSEIFDQYYYEHGCGRPYQRDEHWLNFFGKIAGHIVDEIQPKTVLDAGCAMGFLVEKLREQGVEAFGIDISSYAIENVHPDIAEYCQVGSITRPFSQRYDLIVSIEVVEHMSPEDSKEAIRNLCQHTDDILFSSTPFDYKEATHYNVQPPEVWAQLFARQGFYRDVDFDASFLTPWAVRFRKMDEPAHRIVRDYERRFWLLWKENTDLRNLVNEMRYQVTRLNEQSKEAQIKINTLETQREEIFGSRSWKWVQSIHRMREKFLGKRLD